MRDGGQRSYFGGQARERSAWMRTEAVEEKREVIITFVKRALTSCRELG